MPAGKLLFQATRRTGARCPTGSALRGCLAPEQREVLLLVALEDMTYADVSNALGIPIGTVMSRLSRARERLQREIEGTAYEAPGNVVPLRGVK